MDSPNGSPGGGSNFPRSIGQCRKMKSTLLQQEETGSVLVCSCQNLQSVPTIHSSCTCSSQFGIVPVLTRQDDVEAPLAKKDTIYTAQAPVYFPSKHDNREQYVKNRASSQKEAGKKSVSSTNSKKNSKKNNKKKSKNKQNNSPAHQHLRYEHQSSMRSLYPTGIFQCLRSSTVVEENDPKVSSVMDLLESFGLLSYTISKCKSKTEVAAQLCLALKLMLKGSIVEKILEQKKTLDFLKDTFGYNIFSPQAEEVESQDWLSHLPNLKEDWDLIRNSPIFEKISNLISIAATIGLCSVTNLTWNVAGVDMFRLGSIKKHSTAMDFFSAFLDTVTAFIEGGYECFKQQSLRPMFFTTDAGSKFESLYFSCVEAHPHAMIFNLAANKIMYKGKMQVINDLEYSSMLDEVIEMATSALRSSKGTWQASVLNKRLEKMIQQRADYNAKRIDGNLRFAPQSFYIWGDSGVGKSTISQIVMSDCLKASGADPDPAHIATIKESDKYDSTLKGDTQGIFLDDIGNTKVDFSTESPVARLIDINNNMITYANKADLHEKGKIEIRPRVLVMSSNAPLADHARRCSINPLSIVRRADVHIHVKVKPEFALPDGRLDSAKVNAQFPDETFEIDIWDLTVFVPNGKHNKLLLGPINGGTKPTKMNIHEMLDFVTDHTVAHFDNQRKLVAKSQNLIKSRDYCEECNRPHRRCICPKPEPEVEEKKNILQRLGKFLSAALDEVDDEDDFFDAFLDPDAPEEEQQSHDGTLDGNLKAQLTKLRDLIQHKSAKMDKQASCEMTFDALKDQLSQMNGYSMAISLRVPNFIIENTWVQRLYMLYNFRNFLEYEKEVRMSMFGVMLCILLTCTQLPEHSMISLVIGWFSCFCLYFVMLAKWKDDICSHLASRRNITDDLFASLRHVKALQLVAVCVVSRFIYKMIAVARVAHDYQATLAPKCVKDLDDRDKDVNPWAIPHIGELHVSHENDTMTHEQVLGKASKNLFHGTFVENDFQQGCDLLALGGDQYLAPLHILQNRKDMKARIVRHDPKQTSGFFRAMIGVDSASVIPGKDACVLTIPSGGTRASILHLFPESCTVSGNATMLYRNEDGTLRSDAIRAQYVSDCQAGGSGYKYECAYDTFSGLCGAIIVGNFAKNPIAAVHLRGITGRPSGMGLTLTRGELEDAIRRNHEKISSFPAHVNGTFPTERYDQQVITSRDVHPKSPINYLPVGSNLDYMGRNNQRATHTKSNVIKTPISDTVEQVTGQKCEHGPPKFDRDRMWQASLAYSANASPGVETSLLDKAVTDYSSHLKEIFKSEQFGERVRKELKPLGPLETLRGIDGKRFVDAMPLDTAKGFPLTGTKREWVHMLDPADYPSHTSPAECDKRILEEMEVMRAKLLKGERCYSIFKACVKDEPTKIGKDKVRVFQACDWASQLLIREKFLPIVRLLSLHPLDSECAVGVNAQGPEWDQLARHMKKFGKKRILAGDYSKYDLRMPAQLIIAAFKVLIDLAAECGDYSEDDIKIMKGIATEIAHACVSFNGDVFILCGSNPSGQNLTVYINCIVNCLLLRCAYYKLWPEGRGEPLPFRLVVAIMVYGDDIKGSVRSGFDWFNHITFAKFLAERDIVFTMPDKESVPTEYMCDDDADFLKRKNRFNEETGLIHGILDETSIFKSLHTVLRSKSISVEDQSAQNIDGALREWWQYGRATYESRRSQMTEVAKTCKIDHLCSQLNVSYDNQLQLFKERYELK